MSVYLNLDYQVGKLGTCKVMGGGISKEQLEQRHVVVVGGGYGGVELATILLKWEVPFTLVDPKDYFHHCVGSLRAVLEPEYLKKTAIDYKKTFGDKFLQGWVTDIRTAEKKVLVALGGDHRPPAPDETAWSGAGGLEATAATRRTTVLEYTDLVIAVGSQGPFPGKTTEPKADELPKVYSALSEDIEKATNVIIVGGGAVGVEMAGEIADKYSAKLITVIHSRSCLVSPTFGERFQTKLQDVLLEKNIQTLLDEKVVNMGELVVGKYKKQTVQTSKGQSYASDIILDCTGLRPETTLTEHVFDASKFDNNKRLKVTGELLVVGESNVYAIGDCCNTPEEKQAFHASAHAQLVALNIWRDMKNQEKVVYRQTFSAIILTVGKYAGAANINGWHLPSFLVGLVKGRGLFTSKFWSLMNQTQPS